jgi:SAM-dependent methyltransferase
MQIKSPVTQNSNIIMVEQFQTGEIIDHYKKFNIDVERFFTGLSVIQLYQCLETDYRFFYPANIFGDDLFYKQLQEKIPNYYHTNRWEHKKAQELLPSGASVLEIGCGDGVFLSMIRNKAAKIKGLELNPLAVEHARIKGLDVSNDTVQDFSRDSLEKFDVVCCFQVLEHIYNVNSFLEALIQLAKPNGTVIIGVPNNNPYLFKWNKNDLLNLPPHHAGWWNRSSLIKLSTVFPLVVSNIITEPLNDPKIWYQTQVAHYKARRSALSPLMQIIPRPVYKGALKMLRNFIEGQSILAVYKKGSS